MNFKMEQFILKFMYRVAKFICILTREYMQSRVKVQINFAPRYMNFMLNCFRELN